MTRSNAGNRLEQGPFVEEIVHIIHTAPLERRLRVGIYGTWGSGKTSVLNMLHERLQQHGHVLVRFDPWYAKPKNIAYITNAESPYAAFNSYQLLRLLFNDNGGFHGIAMIENIAKDTSVTQALWKCATRVPINPRMKPNLERIRSILDPAGSSLAVPAWW
jgi:ABC-type cobalamin/Fe3+-siderophores transport system ATPase subunit